MNRRDFIIKSALGATAATVCVGNAALCVIHPEVSATPKAALEFFGNPPNFGRNWPGLHDSICWEVFEHCRGWCPKAYFSVRFRLDMPTVLVCYFDVFKPGEVRGQTKAIGIDVMTPVCSKREFFDLLWRQWTLNDFYDRGLYEVTLLTIK